MPPKSKSKKIPKPTITTKNNNKETTPKPNWPPLRPLPPPQSQALTPLLPDQIYLLPHFLSAPLCKTYVSFLSSLQLTTTPGRPKKDEAVRVNDRFQVQDERFAEMLWEGTALGEVVRSGRMEGEDDYGYYYEEGEGHGKGEKEDKGKKTKELWGGEPLGLNANIRVYRYSKGQFFAQHYDDSNTVTFTDKQLPSPVPARTTWTLLIYLSTCTGGETVFYPEPTHAIRNPEPISVAPELGMALLHRHGDQCLLHEGMEVLNGEKWVLRSDLVVKR